MKVCNHIIHLFRSYHPRDINIGLSFRHYTDGDFYFEIYFLVWSFVLQVFRREK